MPTPLPRPAATDYQDAPGTELDLLWDELCDVVEATEATANAALPATAAAAGALIDGAADQPTPADADRLAIAVAGALRRLSWANLKAALLAAGHATVTLDGSGEKVNGLVANGIQYLLGPLVSGQWMTVASVNRLLLSGTGTITIDSRDRAGTVSSSVESYSVTGAVNQLEYPFFGETAVQIRATLTGSATCEVI